MSPGPSTHASAPQRALAQQIVEAARLLERRGLTCLASGNLSARRGDEWLITPSGVAADRLDPEMIVPITASGQAVGAWQPSSEWPLHRDLYAARAEIGAVVHTHPPCATALACLRRDIPPFHYMIARFGGDSVRCADYACFGSAALSAKVLSALAGRSACLMANHGMLVVGRDLDDALAQSLELEVLCEQYWRACTLGAPVLLSADDMAEVHARFARYGQPLAER